MNVKKSVVTLLALTVSILPDIIVLTYFSPYYRWILPLKLIVMIMAFIFIQMRKDLRPSTNFALIGIAILLMQALGDRLKSYSFWKDTFPSNAFVTNIAGSLVQKAMVVVVVLTLLFILFKDRRSFFLTKGDLSVKAKGIKWLGIDDRRIAWGKLALISGILISAGTFVATILTVTGFKLPGNFMSFVRIFPIILLFGLLNSLFEGIVYRNGILGTLSKILPANEAILLAAVVFGSGHYYGASGGIVGVAMSTLLGWYMGRSMLETKGMASAWLIHFIQDVVIFTAFFLFAFK